MVSMETGRATPYSSAVAFRAGRRCSSSPATTSTKGMVVGENSRDNDLDVNPARGQGLHQRPGVDQGGHGRS